MNKDFKRMYLVSHKFLFNDSNQSIQQKPRAASPPPPPPLLFPTPMETDATRKRRHEEATPAEEQEEEEEEGAETKRIRNEPVAAPAPAPAFKAITFEKASTLPAAPAAAAPVAAPVQEKVLKKIPKKFIEKKKHFCYICNKEYGSERIFNRHVALVHEGKRINKDNLIVSVPKKFEIIHDIKKLKPFICTYCDKTFKNHTEYDKHLKSVHNAPPVTESQLYKRGSPKNRRDIIREFEKVT